MNEPFSRLTAAAAALLVTATLAAQPAPQAPQEPADAEASIEVSDQEMETFASIYVELQQTADRYEQEIADVETEQQAQEVQTRMQQESIETLEKHGWTPDKFNRVAEALNQNPALIERTLQLIEEKS
jgi:Holliday junction resolvasome RuvABC DNA-binding subunit